MFAVIMAGGSGTRFWPASRDRLPKQFLKITGNRTLFEETMDRLRPFVAADQIYAVVGRAHTELTRQALSQSAATMLVEPAARNTAAAIGLAAIHVRRRDPEGVMIVLPADHFIADLDNFARTAQAAGQVAAGRAIVTIGIQPTRPETGYGYIQMGEEAGRALDRPYYRVARFVEKPDRQTALEYLAGNQYAWNSGIFVFTARTILAEIAACLPELAAGLEEIAAAIGGPDYDATLERVYRGLESISIDYGVMEKTRAAVYAFKADFAWSDVGSWQALYELRAAEADSDGNLLLGDAAAAGAKGNLVYSTAGRAVALLGVEGLVVVDTPDALLIADRARS
ncbi:MAG TPA: mannose-1-phosphate guanylyltransferase, partial [Blastocatellia bacterium]|nr:mannose-1-phosphate guanylyltransferase [Blastocatellia bacterium]